MGSKSSKMHQQGSNDDSKFPPNQLNSNKWSELTASQEEEVEFIRKNKATNMEQFDSDDSDVKGKAQIRAIYTPIRVGKERKAPSLFDNSWLYDSESTQPKEEDDTINSFQRSHALDGMSRPKQHARPLLKVISCSSGLGQEGMSFFVFLGWLCSLTVCHLSFR